MFSNRGTYIIVKALVRGPGHKSAGSSVVVTTRRQCRTCSVSGTGRRTKTLGNGAGPEPEGPGRRWEAAGAWRTS